jgi:hypothetical protein
MQFYTLLGAGGFGLVHLFYPSLFSLVLGAPDNGAIMGDVYVASVFLSFALMPSHSLLPLGSEFKASKIS